MQSMSLNTIKNALLGVSDAVYHFSAPPNTPPPYIEWAEDGENAFMAGNRHAETAISGTIDLYTKDDSDPLRAAIPEALNNTECAWYKNSTQYEENTGLIHDEWVFEVF